MRVPLARVVVENELAETRDADRHGRTGRRPQACDRARLEHGAHGVLFAEGAAELGIAHVNQHAGESTRSSTSREARRWCTLRVMTDERQGTLIAAENATDRPEGAQASAPASDPRTGRESAGAPPEASLRARVRRVRRAAPVAETPPVVVPPREAPIAGIGAVPPTADVWSIQKRVGRGPEDWETLEWAPPGQRVAARQWPLDELTEDAVCSRWGAGEYRLEWSTLRGVGGRRFISRSFPFTIRESAPPPAEVAAPVVPNAAPLLTPELQQAFALMGLLEQQTTNKLAQIAQLGQVLGGGGQQTAMIAMLQEQQRNTLTMFREMMQQQQQANAAMVRALREGDEDDERGAGEALAGVASTAAAAAFDPDSSFVDIAKQAFAKDPAGVLKGLKELVEAGPQLIGMVREILPKAPAPPPPPAPAPRRLERNVSRDTGPMSHTEKASTNGANGAATPAKSLGAVVTNMPPAPAES